MPFFRNMFRTLSIVERRILWIALCLLAAGAAGLVIFFIRAHTISVPAHSGAYTEGMVGQPSYVNPVLAASDEDQALTRLVFANLQDLADNIETSPDGGTIQLHLKQGLQWSDGQALTSDDVIFTLQAIQNPDSRSPLVGLFEGVTADRASALEVDFHLQNIALAPAIRDLRPLPEHLYHDIPPANWRLSDYNLRPVGSGPYVFASHDTGPNAFISTYRLNTNPHYAGAAPYLQQVSILFFHNSDDLFAAFNGGKIQGFGTTDAGALDHIQRPYALTRFTTPTVYAVFWNDTTNPALGAFEAREALDLAIDLDRVLAALKGYAEPANGPLPPALFTSVSGIAQSSSTASSTATSSIAESGAARAAQILKAKGWQKGDDGIWVKGIAKTTVRLEFTLTVPDITFLKNAAQSLVDQWQAFGAEVHLTVMPTDASLTAAITNRSYDGLLFGNTVRGTGDLYPFWHSSERFAPGLNLAVYKNAKVDSLLQTLRQEKSYSQATEDMATVSNLITDDEPAVFLFSADDFYVASKNVEGVSSGFLENPADRMDQLPQWYVETTRRLK